MASGHRRWGGARHQGDVLPSAGEAMDDEIRDVRTHRPDGRIALMIQEEAYRPSCAYQGQVASNEA